MTESKITEGLWETYQDAHCISVKDGEGYPLLVLRTGERSVEENEANAQLIAAAPELLAALEALLEQADLGEVDEETQPIVDQAKRAINKATVKE